MVPIIAVSTPLYQNTDRRKCFRSWTTEDKLTISKKHPLKNCLLAALRSHFQHAKFLILIHLNRNSRSSQYVDDSGTCVHGTTTDSESERLDLYLYPAEEPRDTNVTDETNETNKTNETNVREDTLGTKATKEMEETNVTLETNGTNKAD